MGGLEREAWFRREYVAVATLDSGRGYPLTVYRRHLPADPFELPVQPGVGSAHRESIAHHGHMVSTDARTRA